MLPFQDPTGNTTSAPFFEGGIPWVPFLTIDRRIEVSGISLYITNQVIHIQIMLLPNTNLDFSSHDSKYLNKTCYCLSFLPLHEFFFFESSFLFQGLSMELS